MTDDTGGEGFAPSDYTDARERWEWKSGYSEEANKKIRFEAVYCVVLMIVSSIILLLLLTDVVMNLLPISSSLHDTVRLLGIAWFGGTLGGAIYSVKWLYHTVGKGWWHMDRRMWRLLTPFVSAGVSFAFLALAASNLFSIVSYNGLNSGYTLIGISFLLGYFSDTAVAKLAEIASVLFGTVRDHEPTEPDDLEDNRGNTGGEDTERQGDNQ